MDKVWTSMDKVWTSMDKVWTSMDNIAKVGKIPEAQTRILEELGC
jgi:hypothetical protein